MHSRSNAATIMVSSRPMVSAERSFKALHPHLVEQFDARRLATSDPRPRVVVASVDRDGRVRTAQLGPKRFLVVGRHTQCGLHTGDDDESVSLRHAVVWWDADPVTGAPRIRVWDLRAGAPLVTEDGRSTRAVVADGALFAVLGTQALWVLPLDGEAPLRDPNYAWGALPERSFGAVLPVTRIGGEGRSRRPTTITLTHAEPPMPFGQPLDGAPEGEVTVELPGGRTERSVSGAQLDRGLLFGRYERCQLTLGDDGCLSRVHLFVVRIDGEVWAVDTASTNGTHHNGAQVDAVPLGDRSSLLLGRQCVVKWRAGLGPSGSA